MRRFEEIPTTQLLEKIQGMGGAEYGEILKEWLIRSRESCQLELEECFNNQTAVTLLQGRIITLKELITLLNPKPNIPATPTETGRRLPWHS